MEWAICLRYYPSAAACLLCVSCPPPPKSPPHLSPENNNARRQDQDRQTDRKQAEAGSFSQRSSPLCLIGWLIDAVHARLICIPPRICSCFHTALTRSFNQVPIFDSSCTMFFYFFSHPTGSRFFSFFLSFIHSTLLLGNKVNNISFFFKISLLSLRIRLLIIISLCSRTVREINLITRVQLEDCFFFQPYKIMSIN